MREPKPPYVRHYCGYVITCYEALIDGSWQWGWGVRSKQDSFVNQSGGPYLTLREAKEQIRSLVDEDRLHQAILKSNAVLKVYANKEATR